MNKKQVIFDYTKNLLLTGDMFKSCSIVLIKNNIYKEKNIYEKTIKTQNIFDILNNFIGKNVFNAFDFDCDEIIFRPTDAEYVFDWEKYRYNIKE